MTDTGRELAIKEHGIAHEARVAARRKARIACDERKKKRGLAAAVARIKQQIILTKG